MKSLNRRRPGSLIAVALFRLPFRIALLAAAIACGRAACAQDMPLVVAELADAYVASVGQLVRPDELRTQYAQGFFIGFVNSDPATEGGNQPDVWQRSYEAGHAYLLAHPQERDAIFQGYGFTRVSAEGTWSSGWELNDFRPEGTTDETWSLNAPGRTKPVVGGDLMRTSHDKARMRVAGYVSARTTASYFLGLYHRAAFVTAVSPDGTPTPTPTPPETAALARLPRGM